MKYLISTDLDGTLLDHYSYSWLAAEEALSVCYNQQIPVILNTSKTLSEVRELQTLMKIQAPMIVENGSALVLPLVSLGAELNLNYLNNLNVELDVDNGDRQIIFGAARSDLLKFIDQVREKFDWKFAGFNDWSVEQIAEYTGLEISAAQKASEKKYSEPFVWHDSESALTEFSKLVTENGFQLLRGGRFMHLQGVTNKGVPIKWLQKNIHGLYPSLKKLSGISALELICLGDNHNDVDMLNIADFPVCVRSPVADFPTLDTKENIIFTKDKGPKGWNQAVLDIISI